MAQRGLLLADRNSHPAQGALHPPAVSSIDSKYQTPGASNMAVISGGTVSDGRGGTYDPTSGAVSRTPWAPPAARPVVSPTMPIVAQVPTTPPARRATPIAPLAPTSLMADGSTWKNGDATAMTLAGAAPKTPDALALPGDFPKGNPFALDQRLGIGGVTAAAPVTVAGSPRNLGVSVGGTLAGTFPKPLNPMAADLPSFESDDTNPFRRKRKPGDLAQNY